MPKSTRKTSVTCTCQLIQESISIWRGQNNLKIVDLFYERSQKHQANFQIMLIIMFKYDVCLSSNRGLVCFGEFPHIENSILVFAVNCCIISIMQIMHRNFARSLIFSS